MPAIEPVEITAGEVHLRPWRDDDADGVFAICQDPQIQRGTRLPLPYVREHAVDFVSRISPTAWATGTGAHFAVVDATTGELLASVGLADLRDPDGLPGVAPGGDGEVGYWCAAAARNRGVTTAAVGAICRWGFAALGLRQIRWQALADNTASARVAAKAGFTIMPEPRPLPHVRDGRVRDFLVGVLRP
ncbi:MAG: GNAT family N-acetyltransferase [Frankia sp.]|nr:GNAT family N-acetyltransferase [Frankia sp.]